MTDAIFADALRLVGLPKEAKTKTCPSCGHALSYDYFGVSGKGNRNKTCLVCRDEARRRRLWTQKEVDRLVAASRAVLDRWPKCFGQFDEEELDCMRELLAATGREHSRP